ncbi:LysR family transcriptional regulator [Saccharothrix lopnurensis]|uniref:LysR family transcriptional regulator n=1 Tax=Saccharothrix lopnurensis TaxID=1670621 RepID=A0ABW1PEQ5_9PSEU
METRHLLAFATVAQTGSFTKAAEVLSCSQPTVTARIKTLEDKLGAPLFRRLRQGVRLTRAGAELLPLAADIIKLTDKALRVNSAGDEPRGDIVIGTTQGLTEYRLFPLVEYVHWRHPDIRLSLRSRDTPGNLAAVRDGDLDCAFFTDGVEHRDGLDVTVLCEEPLVLVTGHDHPLARRPTVTDADLRGVTLITVEDGVSHHDRLVRLLDLGGAEHRSSVLALDSVEVAKRAAASGLGVALLPSVAVRAEVSAGRLHRLPWSFPFRVYTQLARRRGSPPDAALAALTAAATRVVSEQVAEHA